MRLKNRQILIAILAMLALAVAATLYFRNQVPSLALDPQEAALAQLRQDSQREPRLHFYSGFPGFAEISIPVEGESPVERARNFLSTYQDLYLQNDPNLSLEVLRQEGEVVVFFQTYKTLRVFAAQIAVNMEDDTVFATVGRLLTSEVERQALDLLPAMTDQDAVAIARVELDLAEAKLIGNPELVIFDPSFVSEAPAIAHLAWQFTLHGNQTMQALVDAHTGELLFSVPFSLDLIDLDMQDAENEANSSSDSCYNLSNDPYVGDEADFNSDYNADVDAVNAYDQIFKAYSFYLETFGRDSYDNDNGQLEVFIHADVPNAQWSPNCELLEFATGFVAYDVMVHEFNHGVISETSSLIYSYQSGALDESYADVMGVIADQLDGTNNWTMGENVPGGPVRNISNQVDMNDYVFTANVGTPSQDWGGVHINSVIPSYAAYLIANGGGPFNLTGIGTGKTLQLYYITMITLPANASFSMASGATIARANLFAGQGFFTIQDACMVRNAFATIGLEQGDWDCDGALDASDNDDDDDAVMDWEDNCKQIYNPGQKDSNTDNIGDICQPDTDEDGIPEGSGFGFNDDNCPDEYNPEQTDANFNGIGEACDPTEDDDFDDDGINNVDDNCPYDHNPGQANYDAHLDDDGAACDPDDDQDGVSNDNDNCPFTANWEQTDSDIGPDGAGDGAGDACDKCPNTTENIAAWTSGVPELGIEPKPLQPDSDGDGIPNACDGDFFVIGDGWETAIKSIHAFELIDFILDGDQGDLMMIPLPACMPAENAAKAPRLDRNFVLEGLDPSIFPQLVNGEGKGAGKPRIDGGLVSLSVTNPLGGDSYFLQLLLGRDYLPGESSFKFSYNCSEPEEGQPAATATSIPLVELIAIPSRNANCRQGPSSTSFESVDIILMGVEYMPIAQGPDQMWLLFDGPDYAGKCWVQIDSLDLFCNDVMVDTADTSPCTLPIAQYPPFPTLTPTPTFTPEAYTPQCSDGIDNDGDGLIDLGDRECSNANDNDEAN